MTWYPEAAGTEDPGGPYFDVVTSSSLVESVTGRVSRESQEFHEKMAQKLGVQTEAGRVHLRAARVYREGKARFHENSDELGELPPRSIIAAHKSAAGFHKKAAEKAGLDTDEAHAHVAELERHLDMINKAKRQLKASEAREHGTERKRSGFSDRSGVNEAREAYIEPRQEDSHEEGTFVGSRYEKSHQAERGS